MSDSAAGSVPGFRMDEPDAAPKAKASIERTASGKVVPKITVTDEASQDVIDATVDKCFAGYQRMLALIAESERGAVGGE